MPKRTRIIAKTLGLILLLLLLCRAMRPDYSKASAVSVGAASGMLLMFLIEEFQ